jgi:hypothetical protein
MTLNLGHDLKHAQDKSGLVYDYIIIYEILKKKNILVN